MDLLMSDSIIGLRSDYCLSAAGDCGLIVFNELDYETRYAICG